jgi:outer membrane protein OmpA-like peptidoglycan-associated protein
MFQPGNSAGETQEGISLGYGRRMRTRGLVLVLAFASLAQQALQAQIVRLEGRKEGIGNKPTPSDIYCSGFITTDRVPTDHYVAAGWNSPDQTRYGAPIDYVYIHGRNINVGDRYQIVRPVKDPDEYEFYSGQRAAIRNAGEPYFEMGYAKVIDVQKESAVAVPELACSDFVVGDLAIPFTERQVPVFRVVPVERFAKPSGKPVGRIIMGSDFDSLLGNKYIAYIDLGENKGIKVGDYLRATRTYNYAYHDRDASMSRYASVVEDTQKNPQKLPMSELSSLPRRTLGNMIVLQVHKKSSTVMIVSSLEDIHVGDGVELMDVSNAPFMQSVAPAAPSGPAAGPPVASGATTDVSVASPPRITCSAQPASVRVGESSVISCEATSPDNRPISITFVTNGGKLSTSRNQATLDTADTGPGPIAVRATAYDDRQLTASATTTVTVEAPPASAPTPQKLSTLDFKPNSAYVNNRSKAILDDVALKLQQDPTSTAVLYGANDDKEPARLATQRAENTKTYLTKSKGIDPQRIQTKPGSQPGRTVEIWTVPAGATAPTEPTVPPGATAPK